jgi:hypothetical protein
MPSEPFKIRLWWCRWNNDSWCRKAIRTHFLKFGDWKKRFGRIRGSDVLTRRMDLRTHNLPSKRFEKQLWWIRCMNVSKWRKAIRTHFLHPK